MNQDCETLKVTQVGGFAGNGPLPPLINLKRSDLDEAGRKALDEACHKLAGAAATAGEAPAIGADLAGYRIEMGGRQFTLPPPADVPGILAPLLAAAGTAG